MQVKIATHDIYAEYCDECKILAQARDDGDYGRYGTCYYCPKCHKSWHS
jgi:hypothetical protein